MPASAMKLHTRYKTRQTAGNSGGNAGPIADYAQEGLSERRKAPRRHVVTISTGSRDRLVFGYDVPGSATAS